ncbi:unnamed protein product [Chrysoparadoxa australica]
MYNPLTNEYIYSQAKAPGQTVKLSEERATSTILKGDYTPEHQPKDNDRWVYPSEQQYFNALQRKGWKVAAEDVPSVVAIHNMVNEQGWREVGIGIGWERLAGEGCPRLVRFSGRPTDMSPKAWLKTNILGYTAPFDRHDWVVKRGDKEVRYVIDFYKGEANNNAAAAMHLDVRPALDSVDACFERIRRAVSVITTPSHEELRQQQQQQQQQQRQQQQQQQQQQQRQQQQQKQQPK